MAIKKHILKSGKVRWKLIAYDDMGRQVWRTFDTKADAVDYESRMRVAKRENNYPEVFKPKPEYKTTFAQLAEKYAELYKDRPAWQTCKASVVKALVKDFGHKRLSQITRLDLELWRKKRLQKPDGSPRNKSSVDQDMAHFRHMLNKAKEWGLLEKSPFDNGQSLFYKPDNARKRFLSHEEMQALFNACPPTLRTIVEVAILTGLRKNNVLGLTWEMVDLKAGFINIPAHQMKAKKAHKLPIGERLAAILRELRRKNMLKSPYVFVNDRGRQIRFIGDAFRKACKQADVRDFRFHDLRHSFASHLIMAGADLVTVGSLLGHADVKTTMRYAHLSQAHRKAAVGLLDSLPGISEKLVEANSK